MLRLTFFLFALFPFFALAQAKLDSTENTKVLIIPFEEKLFYCDIMRDLTTVNKMSKDEVYHRFRNEIQLSISAALKDSMETASFLSSDSLKHDELVNIYEVLGYDFLPVPVVEEKGENGKKKKVQEPAPKREVGVRNGQVIADRQVVERYMSAKLKSTDVLHQLHSTYGFNRFIFINQLDVKMDLSDPENAFINPMRVAAVHYSILDKDGKSIGGGLASSQFPGTENDMNHIIGANFYKLSAEVLGSLLKSEKKEALNSKTKSH
ncbi:MAG: hypothetical protein K9G46_04830 [Flavobacteriales bacterium]|jgi:hypothetical protein|nr:hypothetical protein [Flavobacteriales bacterium]